MAYAAAVTAIHACQDDKHKQMADNHALRYRYTLKSFNNISVIAWVLTRSAQRDVVATPARPDIDVRVAGRQRSITDRVHSV